MKYEEINDYDEDMTGAKLGIKGIRANKAMRYLQNVRLDEFPKREKILSKQIQSFDRERADLGYNILVNILTKSIGRPWNKVYSEILTRIKDNFTKDLHTLVLDALSWIIETKPLDIGNGVLVRSSGYPFRGKRDFYVDPKNGIVRRAKKEWEDIAIQYSLRGPKGDYYREPIVYSANKCYRKRNGIWFNIELVNIPSISSYKDHFSGNRQRDKLNELNLYDVVLKSHIESTDLYMLANVHGYRTYQNKLITREQYLKELENFSKNKDYLWRPEYYLPIGHYIYAKSMRQISKAEIRREGLESNKLSVPNIVQKHR